MAFRVMKQTREMNPNPKENRCEGMEAWKAMDDWLQPRRRTRERMHLVQDSDLEAVMAGILYTKQMSIVQMCV